MPRPPFVWVVIVLSFIALAFKVPLLLMVARDFRTDADLSAQLYVIAACLVLFFVLLWIMCRWWIVPMAVAYVIDVRAMVGAQEVQTVSVIMPLITTIVLLLHWHHFSWKPHWSRITSS